MATIQEKRNLAGYRSSNQAGAFNRSRPQKRRRTFFQSSNPKSNSIATNRGFPANSVGVRANSFQGPFVNSLSDSQNQRGVVNFQYGRRPETLGFPGVNPMQPQIQVPKNMFARQRPPPPTSRMEPATLKPVQLPVSSHPMSGSDLLKLHSLGTSQSRREAPKHDTVWSSSYVSSQFMSDSNSVPLQIPHVNSACKPGMQAPKQNSFSSSVNLHVKAPISSPAPPALVSDSSVSRPGNVIPPIAAPYVQAHNMFNFTPVPVQIPNVSSVTKPQVPVPIQNSASSYLDLHDKDRTLSQYINTLASGNALLELINFINGGKTQSESTEEDRVPSDFDPEWLKGRHESVISSLYNEIPRQCSSCGVRFRTQEEHGKHMDWHVQKNRTKKNKKMKPSRNYFLTISMWLDGDETAPPAVISKLFHIEEEEEEKEVEQVVPSDVDQKFCALCGEAFEEFFSDEVEDWMYRGAVFMKAPGGWKPAMGTSLLGPIVHAKCLS